MYIFLPFCHSLSILVYLSSFVYFSFYLIVYPQVPRYACFAFNLTLNSSFALFTYAVSALRYIRYLFINVLFIFELPTTPIWSFCLNSLSLSPSWIQYISSKTGALGLQWVAKKFLALKTIVSVNDLRPLKGIKVH